jgi:hypothetical protein
MSPQGHRGRRELKWHSIAETFNGIRGEVANIVIATSLGDEATYAYFALRLPRFARNDSSLGEDPLRTPRLCGES